MNMRPTQRGFTLIEISTVMVIIGLIIGGVLVGKELILSAGVRATITQIESYNAAAKAFEEKYSYLPGDIPASTANGYGFAPRTGTSGDGDGNGVIEGYYNSPGSTCSNCQQGETVEFFEDLSSAHMIAGNFIPAASNPANYPPSYFFPPAKIGGGNYVYLWSGGGVGDGLNYFSMLPIASLAGGGGAYPLGPGFSAPLPGLTVMQAYMIDKKIDDGFPQSGNVTAKYGDGFNTNWAPLGPNTFSYGYDQPWTFPTYGSSTSCFDNGGVNGVAQSYSIEINGGANLQCVISFQFK